MCFAPFNIYCGFYYALSSSRSNQNTETSGAKKRGEKTRKVLSVIKLIKTVFADTWAGKWLDAAVDAESPIIMDPFLLVEELLRSDNALYKVTR